MYQLNKQTIFRGRAVHIPVMFIDANNNNEQLYTAGITGSKIRILKEDGTYIEKAPLTGLAWGVVQQSYMYIYEFTAEETALFKLGVDMTLYLQINFGTNYTRHKMRSFLTIADDAF